MLLKLKDDLLLSSLMGGSMVLLGVVIKNSLEQLGMSKHPLGMIGKLLFVGGWVAIAYSSGDRKMSLKSGLAVGASIGVVIAVMAMKMVMEKDAEIKKLAKMSEGGDKEEFEMLLRQLPMNRKYMPLYAALFVGSWLMLGVAAGMGKSMMIKMMAMGVPALVILSMMVILPWQRKNHIVDNLGMVLFAKAWLLLAYVNSV